MTGQWEVIERERSLSGHHSYILKQSGQSQNARPQGPGHKGRQRQKKEVPEEEVRKKRGTEKGPSGYQASVLHICFYNESLGQFCWVNFSFFFPKRATIWQEAKSGLKSRLAGFKYICGYMFQISTPPPG